MLGLDEAVAGAQLRDGCLLRITIPLSIALELISWSIFEVKGITSLN